MKFHSISFIIRLSFIMAIILLFSSTKPTFALNIIYQQDFNNYSDGSLPVDWISDNTNSTYWQVSQNKLVGNVPKNGTYSHIIKNEIWTDYILNIKIKGISGVDRFIVFRVDHSRGPKKEEYYFKYTESNYGFNSYIEIGKGSSGKMTQCAPLNGFSSTNGELHEFQIDLNGNNIKVYELKNNVKIPLFDCYDSDPLLHGGIGFFNQPNGIGLNIPTIFEIDELQVTSQDSSFLLNVPDLKQYDSRWKDDIYDHANHWSPSKNSIERWGCALTASVMILNYYNHNVLPNELNNWLIKQSDGYLRNGLLNWLAVTRFSKIGNSANPSLPILQFEISDNNHILLDTELASTPQGRPAIIKLANHFVVATGKTENDYYINDPASTDNLLSHLSNDYLSLIKFVPSFTDLSYLLITYDYDSTIKIKDPNGNIIPNKYFFTENPPFDNLENLYSLNDKLGFFVLPKPQLGYYQILVSKYGVYSLESYSYDKQGNYVKSEIQGITNNNEDSILLKYGDQNILLKNVSIEQIINAIESAYQHKLIFKQSIYKELLNKIYLVKRLVENNKIKPAKLLLKTITNQISAFSKHFIDKKVSTIIIKDIQTLIQTL